MKIKYSQYALYMLLIHLDLDLKSPLFLTI